MIVVGIGSVIFTGKKEAGKDLSEKVLYEKFSGGDAGELLSGNESVAELIQLMAMDTPPKKFLNAPSFELKSLNGTLVSLKQFRGKTVLLSFWTTW